MECPAALEQVALERAEPAALEVWQVAQEAWQVAQEAWMERVAQEEQKPVASTAQEEWVG
jgi:hypothetical protein